jgi:hypothetical protein
MFLKFANPPQGITAIIARLTHPPSPDRTLILNIVDSSASGTFDDVQVGFWHLKVDALDASQVVRYSGETDVEVFPGETSHVSLQLLPTTGNIEITVTWGGSPQDLVAYYPCSGNAQDASGNNNHAFVVGAVLTSDRFQNPQSAYSLDGNSYLEIPYNTSLRLTRQFTICSWVSPTGFYGGLCQGNEILFNAVTDDDAGGYQIRYADYLVDKSCYDFTPGDEVFAFLVNFDGVTRREIKDTERIVPGNWYFVAGTYDGATMKLYVNGQMKSTLSISDILRPNTGNIRIGGSPNPLFPYPVTGKLDELRIYRRALTVDEITALYLEH